MAWDWVVVENCAMSNERIVYEDAGRGSCQRWIRSTYSPLEICEMRVEMLRRLPSGHLTSNYT